MILNNAEIFNAYEAAGQLLDAEMPVTFAFKIARLLKDLEPTRMAIQVCIEKMKGSDGVPDPGKLNQLLREKVDVSAPTFTECEIKEALKEVTPKVITSLMPFIEETVNG